MKPLIPILFVMMTVGCTTNPTIKNVAGGYEVNYLFSLGKMVYLENGEVETYSWSGKLYKPGKKKGKWAIEDGRIMVSEDGELESISFSIH